MSIMKCDYSRDRIRASLAKASQEKKYVQAVFEIQQIPPVTLAEFIVDAFMKGVISKKSQGIDDQGILIENKQKLVA